jgi:hypothetical protein
MAKKTKKKKKNLDIDFWLEEYILQQVRDLDYVDNLRWGMLGDIEQMDAYNAAKEAGCCGFFDRTVVAPDGNTYAVGCNYGH